MGYLKITNKSGQVLHEMGTKTEMEHISKPMLDNFSSTEPYSTTRLIGHPGVIVAPKDIHKLSDEDAIKEIEKYNGKLLPLEKTLVKAQLNFLRGKNER